MGFWSRCPEALFLRVDSEAVNRWIKEASGLQSAPILFIIKWERELMWGKTSWQQENFSHFTSLHHETQQQRELIISTAFYTLTEHNSNKPLSKLGKSRHRVSGMPSCDCVHVRLFTALVCNVWSHWVASCHHHLQLITSLCWCETTGSWTLSPHGS